MENIENIFNENVSNFEKRRCVDFLTHVVKIEGLNSDLILKLIGLIESTKIRTSLKFKLLACLIPKQFIPEEAFIRMTCLLSDFRFNLDLKVEILKWMISVYSFVDNVTNFLDLYEIFLHFLENDSMRPFIVHFLFNITRKEHATTKRINHVALLLERVEPEPCLSFLLHHILKNFSKYTVTPKEDVKFDFESLGIYPSLIKGVHPSYNVFIPTQYILSENALLPPCPFRFRVQKNTEAHKQSEIDPVDGKSHVAQSDKCYEFLEIYREFKNLEKPAKVQKILKSKFRHLFLTSNISKRKKTSIEDFILVSMYNRKDDIDFLQDALNIFHDMQKCVPGMSNVMKTLIENCNRSSDLDTILGLLSYEPVCCFVDIQYKIDLINEKFLNASVSEKCAIINGFSNLYRNWVLMECDKDYIVPCEKNCSLSCSSLASVSAIHSATDEIYMLGSYIALICDAYLLDSNFHPCLLNIILHHYEKVSMCHSKVNYLVIFPPSVSVFHAALFSLDKLMLNNLCRLMLRLNKEICIMEAKFNPETKLAAQYFMLYRNDIENLLLGREYKSNRNTILSKENVVQRLKVMCSEFEKFLEVYRHPALQTKTASFCKSHQLKILPVEIKKMPQVHSEFFTYLAKEDIQYLAKFLTMSM